MKFHKNKDFTQFVRFGSLKPIKQKGYKSQTFHSPPARRGFYAMPKHLQEFFLISSLKEYQPHNFGKEGDSLDRDVLRRIRREFKRNKGEVWHHLGDVLKPHEIILRNKSWVKTTIKNWKKEINKAITRTISKFGKDNVTLKHFCKDEFEVFFEK